MGADSLLALVACRSPLHLKLPSFKNPPQVPLIHDSTPHAEQQVLQLISSFQLDLAQRLQQLQPAVDAGGNAHLSWLLDALPSALYTHSSLQSALIAAASSSTALPSTLAKHRADELLCMLDVCISLKQVFEDLDRHFGCLQQVLQRVAHALSSGKPLSSGSIRLAAVRLSARLTKDRSHTNMFCVTSRQYRQLADARASLQIVANRELHGCDLTQTHPAATVLIQAIDGAMLTSLLVLASAVSSLSPPPTQKSSGTVTGAYKTIVKYLGGKSISAAWATPLRQLHRDLRKQQMSEAGGSLFQEIEGLHTAARNMHAIIAKPSDHGMQVGAVKQSVESLRKRVQEAQRCISMFRLHMASFCQAFVGLRLALVHMESAS